MEAIRNRWLTRQLQAGLKALPVVVLTGARQTGKTTLAQALPQKRTFVSLDDLGILGQAHADPDSLLATRPVTLDEVQRAPELLLPVKRQVDEEGFHCLFRRLLAVIDGHVEEGRRSVRRQPRDFKIVERFGQPSLGVGKREVSHTVCARESGWRFRAKS